MVAGAEAFAVRRVYRPSSVYGHAPRGRHGLIPALMVAALRRRPAHIFGALTTQRDYVHADDIGRFVAGTVLDPGPASTATHLLAQARPACILEILHLVEAQIGLPVFRRLDPRPANARDTTFLSSALPQGYRATPLSEGIARTALKLHRDHVRQGT
jgi:UDP-glucose 4-epimerase